MDTLDAAIDGQVVDETHPGQNGQGESPEIKDISPLDSLRAKFEQQAEIPRLFKRLPARDAGLVAEYRPIPRNDAKKAIEKDSDPDLLVAALVRVLMYDPAHDAADASGLVPMGEWAGKPELDPLQFDQRFSELLGLPKSTPNQVALEMFEGNTLALSAQAAQLGEWSANTREKEYQDFEVE